jgi:triosephosphate isomerase
MRHKFIAGNWKMFTTGAEAEALAAAVVRGVNPQTRARVAVFPPFPHLSRVAKVLQGSPVGLGAQNLYPEKEGAFTGEVSPAMLVDVGCRYVIIGHSERRHILGENNPFINRKVHAALAAGLTVILCVGETLQERDGNQTESVLDGQITAGLTGVGREQMAKIVVAYEPVWAIGTGRNATPAQAQEAHAFLRQRIGQLAGSAAAQFLTIQYGGSVKPDNAGSLLSQPDVDGALVGGASLKAESFLAVVSAADK